MHYFFVGASLQYHTTKVTHFFFKNRIGANQYRLPMIPKLWLLFLPTLVAPMAEDSRTAVKSPLLRGLKNDREIPSQLPAHPGSSHHSTYQGCLSYSSFELSKRWTFRGQPPDCSWIHTTDNDHAGSSDKGGSTGNREGNTVNEGSGGDGGSSNGSGGYENGGSDGISSNDVESSENGGSGGSSTNGGASNGGNQQNNNDFVISEDPPKGTMTTTP
jgi:hypothetical protein